MNALRKKLSPVIYSVLNLHHMLIEVLSLPVQLKRQKNDWKKVIDLYPGLQHFNACKRELRDKLEKPHRDYIANYSAPLISMSLKRGVFFLYLCQVLQPKKILDLGTGFSSYVFRLFAGENPGTDVISVDESGYWLRETTQYLSVYGLNTGGMISWEEYNKRRDDMQFDLVFVDIGDCKFRLGILPELISSMIDEYHVPFYRIGVNRMCNDMGAGIYSLRKMTRTRLSHNAIIMKS